MLKEINIHIGDIIQTNKSVVELSNIKEEKYKRKVSVKYEVIGIYPNGVLTKIVSNKTKYREFFNFADFETGICRAVMRSLKW